MSISIEEIIDRALQVKVANVGTKVLKQLYKPKYISNLGAKSAPRGLGNVRVRKNSKIVRPRRRIRQQPRRPQPDVPATIAPVKDIRTNKFNIATAEVGGAIELGKDLSRAANLPGKARNLALADLSNTYNRARNLVSATGLSELAPSLGEQAKGYVGRKALNQAYNRGIRNLVRDARDAAVYTADAANAIRATAPRTVDNVMQKLRTTATQRTTSPKVLDRDLAYAATRDLSDHINNSRLRYLGDTAQGAVPPVVQRVDSTVGALGDAVSGIHTIPRGMLLNEGTGYVGRRLANIPTAYNPFRDTQNFISELNRVTREGMPINTARSLTARDMGASNKEVMRIFREDNPFIDDAVMRNVDLGGIFSTPTNFALSAYSSLKGTPNLLRPGRGMLASVYSAPTSEGFRRLQSGYDNLSALLENSFGVNSGLSTGSAALGNIREVVAPAFGATSRTLRAPVADTRILSGIRDIASGGITNQQVFRATNFLEKIPSGRQLSREEFAELIYHLGGDQTAVNTATKILNSRGQASQAVRLTAPGNKSVVKTVSKAVDRARNRLGAQLENQQRINRYHNAYVPRDTMSARDILDRRRFLDTFQDRVLRKTSSVNDNLEDLLKLAYLIGQKLATADFGDNGSSDDMTLSFDSEVKQKTDPKDFASPEDHGNMTPRTNSQTWLGLTDEVNPDKTEATNYKRDYLERT